MYVYMYIYNTSQNSKANGKSNVKQLGILINCKWKLLALSPLIIFSVKVNVTELKVILKDDC